MGLQTTALPHGVTAWGGFGYKVWSMNTKEGYLVNFEVYQGKCIVDNNAHDSKFGKASAPFVRMVENLPEKKLPYQFYVDNVGIIFVRWLDNSVVTVGSTLHGVHPINNVKRYSQAEKKIISVARPNLIGQYNNYMGGTDQMDQNIGKYRISIRGKKWWWCIFTFLYL
ncbi:Transposase IS4 [Popillia japonica]|uniref:Transposase IS4 n=1 Tax=Popillia japonica TaxID=7064 RepID=A0AAW1MHS5_POPJA